MSQADTETLKWPSYSQSGKRRNLQNMVKPFLRWRFWDYLLKILALIGCYVYLLKWGPSFTSFGLNGEMTLDFWWPLNVMLLIGTGGGISQTGIATVGLFGAIFHLRSTHRSLKNGLNVAKAVLAIPRLVTTLLISIGIVLLFWTYYHELSFAFLLGLLVLFFTGSVVFQLLDAALYRKTGASFLALNFIIGFMYLLADTSFSKVEGILFALWVIIAAFMIILIRNRPIIIPIEAGELPRSVINERFPSIDFVWLNAWSIALFVGVILGHTLWNFLIPGYFPFEIELLIGLVILLALSEFLYYFNSKVEVFFEVDAVLRSRKMQTEFLSVKGIESVSKMREYFKYLSRRTQRKPMWIIYLCMVVCLLFVLLLPHSDPKTGIMIAIIPIFISTTSLYLSTFFSSFGGFYKFLRLIRIADIDLNINSKVYIPQNDSFSKSSELDEDRALRIVERVLDLSYDENEKQEIRKYLETQGVLDHPGDKALLIKSLLRAMIKRIPSTATDQPMTRHRARYILKGFFKEALLFSAVMVLGLTLFVALVERFFSLNLTSEQAVLFIFGSTVVAVLSSLWSKYQDALKYMGEYWFRKIFKIN